MRGDPVDINTFLQRPLVARIATNGPTLRPVWYLYDAPFFYWLTDTANFLHRAVIAGERLVLVVDVCDIATGEVVHVRARGFAEIIPVDRERAMRKFARYLGVDQSAWDPRFLPSLDLASTRMCRFSPASMDAADVSFVPQAPLTGPAQMPSRREPLVASPRSNARARGTTESTACVVDDVVGEHGWGERPA